MVDSRRVSRAQRRRGQVPGPKTWASQNEIPYCVARVTPNTRTYRADAAAKLVSFQPAAPSDTDAASVNVDPSNDNWILYDDAYAASQFNATVSTCRTEPNRPATTAHPRTPTTTASTISHHSRTAAPSVLIRSDADANTGCDNALSARTTPSPPPTTRGTEAHPHHSSPSPPPAPSAPHPPPTTHTTTQSHHQSPDNHPHHSHTPLPLERIRRRRPRPSTHRSRQPLPLPHQPDTTGNPEFTGTEPPPPPSAGPNTWAVPERDPPLRRPRHTQHPHIPSRRRRETRQLPTSRTNDTDAASVNVDPSNDNWILYDDAYAASQFNATVSTCRTEPNRPATTAHPRTPTTTASSNPHHSRTAAPPTNPPTPTPTPAATTPYPPAPPRTPPTTQAPKHPHHSSPSPPPAPSAPHPPPTTHTTTHRTTNRLTTTPTTPTPLPLERIRRRRPRPSTHRRRQPLPLPHQPRHNRQPRIHRHRTPTRGGVSRGVRRRGRRGSDVVRRRPGVRPACKLVVRAAECL